MAIFLGSSNFSGSNGSHFVANVYLDSYTQDKTNNTTSYKLHLYAGSVDGWTGYGVAINGYLQGVATGSTTSFPARTQVDLGTYSGILQHDTNGVGTLNVSAYVDASAWSGVGTASINTKYSFPTIPRKANISGQTTAHIESTYTININRLVDNYNYTLRYSITDDDNVVHTDTIATGINQDSYEWTIPEIFYQYWTKPDIKYFKIYCDTYNGNALIGTTELQVQLMVLSKTKPNITEYTFTDINTETVALTGNNSVMVKGYSIGRLFMTAELDYYAKVNKVYSIPEYTEISYNVEKGETNKKQIITVDNTYTDFDSLHGYRIDDTRGLQGRLVARTNKMANQPASVKQIIYTTIDYVPLTLNMSAKRPQATTGEVTVEFSGNYFNSSFGAVTNTLELSWKYRQKGVETWTDGGTFTKDTDYEITGNTFNSKGAISLGNIFDYRNIYEIAIYYKDKLVNTYTSKTITKGLPIFWWNREKVVVNGDLFIADRTRKNEINVREKLENLVVDNLDDEAIDKAPSQRAVNEALKNIYSTSEVKTNKVWIDGKPIYKKTIVGTSKLPAGYSAINHNVSNIGTHRVIKDVEFQANGSSWGNTYANAASFVSSDSITTTAVGFNVGSNWADIFIPIVTIEYTKTTD